MGACRGACHRQQSVSKGEQRWHGKHLSIFFFFYFLFFNLSESATRTEEGIQTLGYHEDFSKILKKLVRGCLFWNRDGETPSQYCWLVRAFTSALTAADQGGEHEAIASISVLSPVCMNYY